MKHKSEKTELLRIIQQHIKRYSDFEIQDLYKMLYQASCGPGHILKNQDNAQNHLKELWNELGKVFPGEPLIEIIDPQGEMIRINLRIYKKLGNQFESLLFMWLQSAREFKVDKQPLDAYGKLISKFAIDTEIHFSTGNIERYWNRMRSMSYPTVRHSKNYLQSHCPAYCVLLKRIWDSQFHPK